MARKVQVILSDDLDDSISADETVTFALDGTTYEIDLSEKNAKALRKAFEPWVGAARRVSGRKTRSTGTSSSGSGVDSKAVRAWAASNGIELSARGRIPSEVVEKYLAAGN